MNKIITAIALATIAITVRAEVTGELQKVYEVPGMTAQEIEKAFGPAIIDVGQSAMSKTQDAMNTTVGSGWLNSLQGGQKTKIRCDVAASSWLPSVNEWVDGDVVLQTKDGRARVTVTLNNVYGPGKDTCLASIDQYLTAKFAGLKKLGNNW